MSDKSTNPAASYDPVSEASYLASIWQLSTPKLNMLAAALLAAEQRGRDAEREWHGMETAPRDGTHILVDLGPGTPPTTVHWFADDPALGGTGNAGWYISVQQNDGPAVNPVAWQHLPIAAAIRKGDAT